MGTLTGGTPAPPLILQDRLRLRGRAHHDEASRVTRIAEGSPTPTNRVRYWYLGAGHLVGTVYNQPSVKSILFDSGDAYDAGRLS